MLLAGWFGQLEEVPNVALCLASDLAAYSMAIRSSSTAGLRTPNGRAEAVAIDHLLVAINEEIRFLRCRITRPNIGISVDCYHTRNRAS